MSDEGYCMKARTLAAEVTDGIIRILPTTDRVLTANGIQLSLSTAVRFHERVDVEASNRRAFLVEHAVAFCAIQGIQSAAIVGLNTEWDLKRPSHCEAKAYGCTPGDVLGRSDGSVWGDDDPSVEQKSIGAERIILGVNREFAFTDKQYGTAAMVSPARLGEGVMVRVARGGFSVETHVSFEHGVTNPEHQRRLLTSRSVAVLKDWTEEALGHGLADVIGDVIGLGRVWGYINVELELYYHEATIGMAKQLWRESSGPI